MKTTGNLGLKKPDGTDIVDITDLNGNMDILDTAVKAVQDHAADTVKHITAAERTAWNAKASTAAATASAAGLMAAADKAKLDGVAAGANNYVHPNHTGDVTSTGDGVTAIAPGVIVNADVNAAAAIDATKIGTGVVSNAEFGYLDGVTSGIQGQLNGKTNLTTTPQQTTADITYYVRTDGNDGNTGLGNTAGGAFKTIQKAIDMIPKYVVHSVNINVSAGTYNEAVSVLGFSGKGSISLTGATTKTGTHIVTGQIASLRNSCRIAIQGFKSTNTASTAFFVLNSNETFFQFCITDVTTTPSQFAFYVESAKVYAYGCSVSSRESAVYAHFNGEILAHDFDGASNAIAYRAGYGGRIHVTGSTPSATTFAVTYEGGLITTGSGTINPWGDNTMSARTFGEMTHNNNSSQQILPAGAWTKVLFTGIYANQKFPCDLTNSKFVVPEDGVYQFSARVGFANTSGNLTHLALAAFVDANFNSTLSEHRTPVNGSMVLTGSATFFLSKGLSVYLYAYSDTSCSLSTEDIYTHVSLIRVA